MAWFRATPSFRPFFVGVGAHKAGTTWLGTYLANHHQVGFSPIKELEFFSALSNRDLEEEIESRLVGLLHDAVDKVEGRNSKWALTQAQYLVSRLQMGRDVEAYKAYFAALDNGQKIMGEITPTYSLLDASGFRRIDEALPEVRILFLMRSPAERAWSHFKYDRVVDDLDAKDVAETFTEFLNRPYVRQRGDYGRTLTELLQVIPTDRLHCVFYEDLFCPEKRERTLRGVTDFLGIDFQQPDFGKRVNFTRRAEMPKPCRIAAVDANRSVYEYVDNWSETRLPDRWIEDLACVRE